MSSPKAQKDMLNIGLNLGVYVITQILAEGFEITPDAAQNISFFASGEIEKLTDMPAEDFSLLVQPVIDEMTKHIKGSMS